MKTLGFCIVHYQKCHLMSYMKIIRVSRSSFANLATSLSSYATIIPHVSHGFKFNWYNFHHLFNGIQVQIKVLAQI